MVSDARNDTNSKNVAEDNESVSNNDADRDKVKICENPLVESEPKRYEKIQVAAKVPKWEIFIYTSYIIASFIASGYSLFRVSKRMEHDSSFAYTLGTGWKFLGRLKDYGDYEWLLMYVYLNKFVIVAVIHSLSSILAYRYIFEYRRHVWTVVGVCALFWILSWKSFLFVWGMSTAFYLVTYTNSVLACWALGLGTLAAMNHRNAQWMIYFVADMDDYALGTLIILTAFQVLKCISFSIESVKRKNGTSDMNSMVTFTYFDIMVFTFYYPCFYLGPNFIYKYFQPQIIQPKRDWHRDELIDILQKFARGVFWMFFLEALLHYLYIHAVGQSAFALKSVPIWTLASMIMFLSAFYQAKYCVCYGLPGCFMMLDRIVPPSNPRCIFRVVYFSEYWRFFDPGLHAFFRNYIYIPLGGSRRGFLRQAIGTFASFSFVCFWHGGNYFLLAWTMSNCLAIFIELFAKQFVSLPAVAQFEDKYLGAAMTRRLHAMCNVPLYIFSIHAIMIFYTDIPNAWILFERIVLTSSWLARIVTVTLLYSATMFSHEVERWEQARIHKEKEE